MTVDRLVVAAAILDDLAHPRRVLAGRRTAPAAVAGRWELPGGKVEWDEDPEAALRREIGEELAVTVRLGPELVPPTGEAWPLSARLRMRVWLAVLADGEVSGSTDHDQLRWLARSEIGSVDWLPGDRPVVDALAERLRGRA